MADDTPTPDGQVNPQGPGGDAKPAPAFIETLPEALRGNEAFNGMSDVGALAQKYLDGIAALGKAPKAPDKADAYVMSDALPKDFVAAFREAAHKAGLSVDQARALDAVFKSNMEQGEAAEAARNAQLVDALKKEWGADFEARTAKAKFAMAALGDQDLASLFNETGLGNHPAMLKFFHRLGVGISEATWKGGWVVPPASGLQRTEAGNPMMSYPSMEK